MKRHNDIDRPGAPGQGDVPTSNGVPPRRRHLPLALIGTLAMVAYLGAGAGLAAAQGKNRTPAKTEAQPAPGLVVPGAEAVLILIRSTLLSLNDAMATGNYTVLRDLAAPSFREANNAARLGRIFSNLTSQRISLQSVAILAPKLPETPNIDANNRLTIRGFFPGQPVQLDFNMQFEAVNGQWRLFGLSVHPVRNEKADAAEPERSETPGAKSGKKK